MVIQVKKIDGMSKNVNCYIYFNVLNYIMFYVPFSCELECNYWRVK